LERVAIVGVGLIGGSFALALRKAGFAGEIRGVGSAATLAAAEARGAIDRGATLEEAAGWADLLYLAQPVGRIISTLRLLEPWVRQEALVTDAGSTKRVIADTAYEHLTRCLFLGGHPMAGKESRGAENADAELFRGRPYVLTPEDSVDLERPAVREFRGWLERIGAREVGMSAEEHDRVVALSSHLPQLASTALAATLAGEELLAGPGLIDATRLALSSYEVWRDILATNADAITVALNAYIQRLENLRENLRTREAQEEFRRGADVAAKLRTR